MHRLPPEQQHQLDQLTQTYWWHVHRIRLVCDLARRYGPPTGFSTLHYLDIGGGTGATTQLITEQLAPASATCVEGDTTLTSYQSGRPIEFLPYDLDASFPLPQRRYHLFTLLDVLEHLHDPVKLLSQLKEAIIPGGLGLVTVPAYASLFSEWDIQMGHRQRYTRRSLQDQCEAAGYRVVWSSYLFSYLTPAAFFLRKILRTGGQSAEFPSVPAWLNQTLKWLGRLEEGITRLFPIPFGTSILMVIRA